MTAYEDYDLLEVPPLVYHTQGAQFFMPESFRPELYGRRNMVIMLVETSDVLDQTFTFLHHGNLVLISTLRDAFIHKIPCKIKLKFLYGLRTVYYPGFTFPIDVTTDVPSPDNNINYWALREVVLVRQ